MTPESPPSTDSPTVRTTAGFLEICVESLAGARVAIAAGADQLEVCSALSLGGLTPSAGLVAAIVAIARPAGVSVRAMVRPRAGDFVYADDERRCAIDESRLLLRDGADGLVFGATRIDASGGSELCRRTLNDWHAAVRRMPGGADAGLTLHRAIDVVDHPVAAIDTAIALGFDQVLSSGGARAAIDGAATLAAMHVRAGERCRLVAAAGVTPDNIAALIAATGLRAFHASARTAPASTRRGPDLGFGQAPPTTDAVTAARLRAALDRSVRGPR